MEVTPAPQQTNEMEVTLAPQSEAGFLVKRFEDEYLIVNDIVQQHCKTIMTLGMKIKDESIKLRYSLIDMGIITDVTEYSEFIANRKLMATLLRYLGCGLSDKNKATSKYGRGLIDDYNLYLNCKNDNIMRSFLHTIHAPKISMDEFVILAKKRNNLVAYVARMRTLTIDNMELIGAPDRTNHKAKPAPIRPREEARKEIDSDWRVQGEDAKRARTEQETTEAGGRPANIETVSTSTTSSTAKVLTNLNIKGNYGEEVEEDNEDEEGVTVAYLIDTFPSICTTGFFMFINENSEIVTANDKLNAKFSKSFNSATIPNDNA